MIVQGVLIKTMNVVGGKVKESIIRTPFMKALRNWLLQKYFFCESFASSACFVCMSLRFNIVIECKRRVLNATKKNKSVVQIFF